MHDFFATLAQDLPAARARPRRGQAYSLFANLTQDTGTFIADADGEVELGIYMGLWKNTFGDLATPMTTRASSARRWISR